MQKIFKRSTCVGFSARDFSCKTQKTQQVFAKTSKIAHASAPFQIKVLLDRRGRYSEAGKKHNFYKNAQTYTRSAAHRAHFHEMPRHKETKGSDFPVGAFLFKGAQPSHIAHAPKLKNHILEIKARFGYVLLSAACTFFVAYQKAIYLTYVFLLSFDSGEANQSYDKKSFIFTDVSEAFSSTISICLFFSSFFVLPLLLYHFFCFFSPSWYSFERKQQRSQIFIAFFCWVCYILLVQIVIIPELCNFFLKFQVKSECLMITIEPRIIEYISWASTILGTAALLFLLFFFFSFCLLTNLDPLRSSRDWKKRHKFVFWLSLLTSSVVSPPEVWSQLFLTCVLFALFETLIWIFFVRFCALAHKKE